MGTSLLNSRRTSFLASNMDECAKRVDIIQAECEIRKKNKLCLEADNSRWEYLPVLLCLQCIQKLFAEAQPKPAEAM